MPATFPGYTPWALLDGDFSLSADQETLTLPASPTSVLRSGSIDTGGTLANVQWTGTATGTILGRTSAAALASRDDRVLITPGTAEWNAAQYDPGLGTLPSAQGWTKNGTPTESVSGGRLNMTTTGLQWYERTLALTASKLQFAQYSLSVASGGWPGFWWASPLTTLNRFRVFYDAANTRWYDEITSDYVGPPVAMTSATTMTIVARSTDSTSLLNGYGELWLGDLFWGAVKGETVANQYSIFGGGHNATAFVTTWGNVRYASLSGVDEYGWETLANPDTSYGRNQRYWQIKGGTIANGTLTGLDIMGSTSAPSDVTGLAVAAVGSTALGGAHAAVAGAAAYFHELLDANAADAVVADQFDYEPGAVFNAAGTGLAAGNYKIRARAVTDDGVKSSTATTSASTQVPAVAPSVALTISASTVAPGGTVTASATLAGGTTATKNGTSWDGSSATIVTGIAGAATAPTIGPYPRFVSGVLRFYKPTAGTGTPTYYKILSSAYPNGPFTVALSTAWGSITWQATDGVGQYVTATTLGLTVGNTTWYTDQVIADDSTSATGAQAAYGGDDASRLCVVSFALGSGYASRTVGILLSGAVTVRGGTFARGSYDVTLDASGNGSVSLPRLNVATYTNGDGGTPYAIVDQSKGVVLRVLIPDASAATFASLAEV